MFFAVAKIGWNLFQPSTLLIWGTLTGALLLATPLRHLGRRLALVAGGLLTICSMLPIGVLLLRPLENSFPHPSFDETWNPTGIIILGGVLDPSLTQSRGPIALTSAAARVTEGVALAYRFPRARLIFSGGAASLRGSERPEADIARNLFSRLGMPSERFAVERASRNTFENALFTRELVGPHPRDSWILVTSAFHMPRAVGVFRKLNFEVVPYPVAYITTGESRDFWDFTFAPLAALPMLDTAVREWVGLAVYWITGRSARFLPSLSPSVQVSGARGSLPGAFFWMHAPEASSS